MWQMKATATNTRPGSMEEEPDMENKQGDNPSQHKMRGWRTAALREQGQSSGTLTNEHNTNKQKNHSNKRHSKSSTESGQTNTQSLNQDARRVQGDNPGQPAKNNPTNKKKTNQRETSRAPTTSWCRTHNKHQRQVRPKQKYTIPMRFMLDITCETISWMVNTHKNGVHNSATMQNKGKGARKTIK